MASLPAVCAGPVSFTDPATGAFVSLPVSSLSFDSGAVQGSGALYTKYKAAADAFLAHLARMQVLVPGPPSPSKPALEIRAKFNGIEGNFVQVEFFDFDYSTPANPQFQARVTQKLVYTGVTAASVQALLGSSAAAGLVFVPGAAPAADRIPKLGAYPLKITAPATSASVDVPADPTGVAFPVQAREAGAEGANTTIEIISVDAARKTFNMEVHWQKSTTARIATPALATTFAYAIEVAPPPGGGAVQTPLPGVVVLTGGANPAEARKASAVAAG